MTDEKLKVELKAVDAGFSAGLAKITAALNSSKPFFQKHWRGILICAIVAVALGGIYYRGYSAGRKACEQRIASNVERGTRNDEKMISWFLNPNINKTPDKGNSNGQTAGGEKGAAWKTRGVAVTPSSSAKAIQAVPVSADEVRRDPDCARCLGKYTPVPTSSILLPNPEPRTPNSGKRWTRNEFGLFVGGGVLTSFNGTAPIGIAADLEYSPVCYEGSRVSACLTARAGGFATQTAITEAHVLAGLELRIH